MYVCKTVVVCTVLYNFCILINEFDVEGSVDRFLLEVESDVKYLSKYKKFFLSAGKEVADSIVVFIEVFVKIEIIKMKNKKKFERI